MDVRHSEVTSGPYSPDPMRPSLAGNWSYVTVVATTRSGERIPVTANAESLELRWVPMAELEQLPLLPAFAQSLPRLRAVSKNLLA